MFPNPAACLSRRSIGAQSLLTCKAEIGVHLTIFHAHCGRDNNVLLLLLLYTGDDG
jgi:hypothetical protein